MSRNTTLVKQDRVALLNEWRTELENGIYPLTMKILIMIIAHLLHISMTLTMGKLIFRMQSKQRKQELNILN